MTERLKNRCIKNYFTFLCASKCESNPKRNKTADGDGWKIGLFEKVQIVKRERTKKKKKKENRFILVRQLVNNRVLYLFNV